MTDIIEQIYTKLIHIEGIAAVVKDEPLYKHCSFRTGGNADLYICAETTEALAAAIKTVKEADLPYYILGRGTNVLIGDKGFRGCVITMSANAAGKSELSRIEVEGNTITAGAGVSMAALAAAACEHGLAGLECAAGIPGSVGGGLVMNAGAYGGELKDVVTSVRVLEEDGQVRNYDAESMEFGYRTSILKKNKGVAVEACFALSPDATEEIRKRMSELAAKRSEKQPLEYPSAGSTFKRPEGYFAGKLIEDAGLRGFSVGGAQVSEKHCGFVINKKEATSADVRNLIEEVQKKVYESSGVRLEKEVIFLGEF